jgi:hypothetical protein
MDDIPFHMVVLYWSTSCNKHEIILLKISQGRSWKYMNGNVWIDYLFWSLIVALLLGTRSRFGSFLKQCNLAWCVIPNHPYELDQCTSTKLWAYDSHSKNKFKKLEILIKFGLTSNFFPNLAFLWYECASHPYSISRVTCNSSPKLFSWDM